VAINKWTLAGFRQTSNSNGVCYRF